MATIKSYTDLEQSKKLAEILPLESADMWYDNDGESIAGRPEVRYASFVGLASKNIPCWSLAALISVLPKIDNYRLEIRRIESGYCCCYTEENNGGDLYWYYADNPINACVAMVEKLNELNLL